MVENYFKKYKWLYMLFLSVSIINQQYFIYKEALNYSEPPMKFFQKFLHYILKFLHNTLFFPLHQHLG